MRVRMQGRDFGGGLYKHPVMDIACPRRVQRSSVQAFMRGGCSTAMLRHATAALVFVFALTVYAQDDARPHWVRQYLANPPEPWSEWRNVLAPEGDAISLELASGGATDYVIVLPESPSGLERRAAAELQYGLEQMIGMAMPVVADSAPAQSREISVGRTSRLASLGEATLAVAGLPDLDQVPTEGYSILVDGERLFLIGGEQMGPLAAVFALLEEDLGMRWYDPALRKGSWDDLTKALNATPWPTGTTRVPRQPDLRAAIVPRTAAPGLPIRHLSWQRSYNSWALRNRVNGGYVHQFGQHGYVGGGIFVHSFHRLVPPESYFESHPEYFSLINGKRTWDHAQICLSNPAVATAAARTAAEVLRRIPASQQRGRHLLSVSAMDWLGDCQCGDCQAIEQATGGYSGLLITFVNRIAEQLAPEFPWVTLTTLAYRQSKQPPTADIRAHPNVAVRFCTDFGASFTWPYHSFYDTQIDDLAQQHDWYTRWQEVSPRMHLWIYPHQYRHTLAPMPNIRAVADNLRFFSGRDAESAYVQQSIGMDRGREPMRYWIFAKLLWNPDLAVDDLARDYIWGTYGQAAAAVFEYERLLWDRCASRTDFSRPRDWIYAIHDEAMYQDGFAEDAREILDRALALAEDEGVRHRVRLLKAGVVYVESVQLYRQMRDQDTPPDLTRYANVIDELRELAAQTGIDNAGYFDGTRTIAGMDEWLADMRLVRQRRFDQRFLPQENWGTWRFRWDPQDRGVEQGWYREEVGDGDAWTVVDVPAFLAQTAAGNAIGYGWYRTTFSVPESHAGKPVELQFGGVDEQAWVYVNGTSVGEHTLESEFMVGQEVTVADLWNRPFTIKVPGELIRGGENVLAVRIHNSAMNAGIHQPVRAYLPDVAFIDRCDGSILDEDFSGASSGGIPAGWRRHIQQRDGKVFGIAEVSRHFARGPTLHLRDQRSHVAVWSESDEVIPADAPWTLQVDLRLTGGLVYTAPEVGAIIGLKRGTPGNGEFFPLVQVDNNESPGDPVALLVAGQVLAQDLAPDRWHRLVIQRTDDRWQVILDDGAPQTVEGQGIDLRGLAFGSFLDWQHVAQDIHIAGLKIGRLIEPRQ